MQLLAVAVALASCALVVLLWVRSKSDGEEPEPRTNGIAWSASFLVGISLVLAAMGGMGQIDLALVPNLGEEGWRLPVFLGTFMGVAMYLLMRVFLFGASSTLHRWSCRLPKETVDTFGHQLVVEIFMLGGMVAAFVLLMSLAILTAPVVPTWALMPVFVAILPLYNTFLMPWVRFYRAPRSTVRDLTAIEAWLDRLRLHHELPRFRVRVQEGRVANAFATAGLGAHLVVIGGGLLERMPHSQLCAVLAHEVAHVVKRHVPRLVLPLTIVGTWLHVLCVISFANPLFDTEELLFVVAGTILAGAFAGLFVIALPGFFMRRMEFQADRLAVEMLGDGEPLVEALTTLAELNRQPLDTRSWSHPTMQARIDAIRALASCAGSNLNLPNCGSGRNHAWKGEDVPPSLP